MKLRTFFSGLAAAVGGLLLIGLLSFWGLTSQNPKAFLQQNGRLAPSAAQFVPRQSPLMVSLLARPDRLWGLRQLVIAPRNRAQSRQTWQALKQWISDYSGLDYDADLRSWLGDEITWAVTSADLDHSADNGQQPGYLLVLTSHQGLQAREAAHLFWQKRVLAGETLVFEQVSGTTLIHNTSASTINSDTSLSESGWSESAPHQFASAVVGDQYVLLANDPQVIRQAIAAYQAPDVSLATDSTYQTLLTQLPSGQIAWTYSNLEATLDWLDLRQNHNSEAAGSSSQKLFLSWQVTPQGISADTALVAAPGRPFTPYSASDNSSIRAMDWLPPDSIVAAGSHNVTALWQSFYEGLGQYEPLQTALSPAVKALSLGSNIDIPDIPKLWTDAPGDSALGLLKAPSPAWVFISKSGTAGSTPEALDRQAQQEGGLSVAPIEWDNLSITAWTRLSLRPQPLGGTPQVNTDVVAVHTQVDHYDVFATSLEALHQVLEARQQKPRQSFQADLALVDTPNAGVLYLDWSQVNPLLVQRWPWLTVLNQISQPVSDHLKTIVMRAQDSDRSAHRGQLTLTLSES